MNKKTQDLYNRILRVAKAIEKLADFMEPEVFQGAMWAGEDRYGDSFMFPADQFSKKEVIENLGGPENISKFGLLKGWFGRRSAPGYLDTTEWMGPFRSQEELMAEMEEMYGSENAMDEEDYDFGEDF